MGAGKSLRMLAAALGLASSLAHAELYIIANPATPISAGDIRDIFTGQKQFAGSTKITPVDNATAQEIFLAVSLRMEASRYNSIWTKRSFREGINPPFVKAGDNDVVDYVRRNPGAVGYVTSPPPASVSIVHVIHQF